MDKDYLYLFTGSTRMTSENVSLVVRLPAPLHKQAQAVAKLRGETVSDVVRAALRSYIQDASEDARDNRELDALIARIEAGSNRCTTMPRSGLKSKRYRRKVRYQIEYTDEAKSALRTAPGHYPQRFRRAITGSITRGLKQTNGRDADTSCPCHPVRKPDTMYRCPYDLKLMVGTPPAYSHCVSSVATRHSPHKQPTWKAVKTIEHLPAPGDLLLQPAVVEVVRLELDTPVD